MKPPDPHGHKHASTMTATHNGQPASNTDPRKIENPRERAIQLRDEIDSLAVLWQAAITRRIYGLMPFKYPNGSPRLAADIQHEIQELQDELDLIISEYLDHRRI